MSDAGFEAMFGMAEFGGAMFSEVGDDLKPIPALVIAPTVKGRDFYISPATFSNVGIATGGDYVLDSTGQFQMVNDMRTAVYLCLMIDAENPNPNRGFPLQGQIGWWFNPRFGSLLYTLQNRKHTKTVPTLARNYVIEALQPLVNANLIKDLNVIARYQLPLDPNAPRLAILATMTDISKNQTRNFLTWVPVGV